MADWLVFVPHILSLLSALAAAVTAWLSWQKIQEDRATAVNAVRHAEDEARKRAMVDLLIAQKSDPRFMEGSRLVRELRENPKTSVAGEAAMSAETREKILSVLNQLEFIAVGIRLGIFDEYLYKQLNYSSVKRTWNAAAGFVLELRRSTGIPTLFRDLENLATKWDKESLDDPV